MGKELERLIEANRRYAEGGALTGDVSAKRREEHAYGQKPSAVVVACSDSRVIPEAVFSAGLGELFVIRTAGNVIGESEFASLEYALHHLKVEKVIVMGHTGCGAVNAALCGEFDGAVGVITRRIKDAIGDETDPGRACALNVKSGVDTIRKAIGECGVRVMGAIYDIVSGKVEFIDRGTQTGA